MRDCALDVYFTERPRRGEHVLLNLYNHTHTHTHTLTHTHSRAVFIALWPLARQYLSVLNIHKLTWSPMLVGPLCLMGPG